MLKVVHQFYGFECRILQKVNRHFDKKLLNLFFRFVTHFGGARFTIGAALLMLLTSSGGAKLIAIASAFALASSHIPVNIAKQLLPRKRPYLIIEDTKFPADPLEDHSFPSGHTTAIFSIILPYALFMPHYSIALVILGVFVGISRIYLGLHYPSDVLAGGILGALTGILSYYIFIIG